MSAYNGSNMISFLCNLQLHRQNPHPFSWQEIGNICCTARVFNSPDLHDLGKNVFVTGEMLESLHDALRADTDDRIAEVEAWNNLAVLDGLPLMDVSVGMVRANPNLIYTIINELIVVQSVQHVFSVHFHKIVRWNKVTNTIRMLDYKRLYRVDVRLCVSSDRDFFRGSLVATNLRDRTEFRSDFEIARSSPLRLEEIVMTELSISERD